MAKDENLKAFRVNWTIEVNATDDLSAAKQALEIQRDPISEALFFNVKQIGTLNEIGIDLLDE